MWGVDMDVTSITSHGRFSFGHGKNVFLKFKHAAGYTLVELLSTIAIVSVAVGLGIPSLKATLNNDRLTTSINSLAGTLSYTRSEAIRRNQHVVICKSLEGTTCTRTGDWRHGWLVYVDANQNRTLDEAETVLGSHRTSDKVQLDYDAFGSRHYLVYRPSGATRTNGTFTFCDPAYPESARALIITKSGRPRLSKIRANGEPLDCAQN